MLSGSTFGQTSKTEHAKKRSEDIPATTTSNQNRAIRQAKGNAIFSDSFANLDNWTLSNNSTPVLDWVHTTNADTIVVTALSPMMSTTVSDGFMYIEGDSQGEGSVQDANLTMATPVDLTNFPFVSVQFEQNTRNWQTTYTMRVSADGGENWIPLTINEDIGTSENSANPELVSINISDIAGGASEVLVEFNYNATWGWHWAIDDFAIVETPENDLAMTTAYYDKYVDFLALDEFLDVDYIQEVEHSNYHKDHVRPLSFIVEVANLGVNTQTDVVLTAEVTDPTGATTSYTSDPIDVEAGVATVLRIDDVMLDAFNGGTDAATGAYSITYSVDQNEEDEVPSNNQPLERSFMVNDQYMATDLGQNWSTYYPTLGEDVIWASRCMFEQEDQVEYISFGVLQTDDAPSQPGDIVFINMRSGSVLETESEDNVMNRYFGAEELDYVISEGDFTTSEEVVWINYMLPEPISVSPGVVYQGEVEIPIVGEDYLWIPFSNGQSDFTGVLYEYSDESGGPQGWWTLGGNNPHIRLGLDFVVGTEDQQALNFKMGQNYPNPTTGSTRIDWELLEPADNVQFRISDINGRTVYQEDLGSRAAGVQESLELNLNLAAGNYQYALQIGNNIIVRKMVITK